MGQPTNRSFFLRCFFIAGTYLMGMIVSAGCSDTRQILTSAPRSSTPAPAVDPVRHTSLTVSMEQGLSPLSQDIEELQFRISEIRVRNSRNEWIDFPAESNHFEINRLNRINRRILQTRIAPGSYDSLAVTVRNVFVLFGTNAGGPVATPDGDTVYLPVTIEAAPDETTSVELMIEPGASIVRDDSCRWVFRPDIVQVTP